MHQSEAARDIANERERTKIVSLPDHLLEKNTMTMLRKALPSKPYMMQLVRWTIEVYDNNFIVMAQNPSIDLLRNIAGAIII